MLRSVCACCSWPDLGASTRPLPSALPIISTAASLGGICVPQAAARSVKANAVATCQVCAPSTSPVVHETSLHSNSQCAIAMAKQLVSCSNHLMCACGYLAATSSRRCWLMLAHTAELTVLALLRGLLSKPQVYGSLGSLKCVACGMLP